MDVQIYVISHKPYKMPDDPMYVPLQVGFGEDVSGWCRDNTGDSISSKNANYCELTGIYWAWRNTASEFVGFAHYRRLPAEGREILTRTSLTKKLERSGIVLPKERHYYIESNYSQYVHAHHASDLELTRAIIAERYAEYLEAYDRRMAQTHGHRFNMMIMRREYLNEYCEWLFDILGELEQKLDIREYSEYDRRVFGFVAERLLDVWLDYKEYDYEEVSVLNTEGVNWIKKGGAFVLRKLKGAR